VDREEGQSCSEERGTQVKPLLTAAEVAELLSVPTSWVYAEARAGRIPHITVGRYRRFSSDSIEEWAKGREQGPRP
jgi:excisionase family DNA binding protein